MARQLSLNLKTWGGSRKGAGRKPNGAKAGVSHLRRPKVTRHTPVHVTLRLGAGLPNLRRGALTKVVASALAAGKKAPGFALVHYSLQSNHLHLMIEADSSATLARGMKSLSIRVARAINRWRGDKGKVFADRYHVHVLATPREARLSLAYLLNNFRKHNVADSKTPLDSCSSSASFDGWKQRSVGFAATASQAEGLWASLDGGQTWHHMTSEAGNPSNTAHPYYNYVPTNGNAKTLLGRPLQIVHDPKNTSTYWVASIYAWEAGTSGVLATSDNGNTFTGYDPATLTANDSVSVDFTGSERKTILAGGHETNTSLYVSTDGGVHWANIGDKLPSNLGYCTHPLVINSQTFLLGCQQGILRSTNQGTSWTQVPSVTGTASTPLWASDGTIYWAATGGGIYSSTNNGVSWAMFAAASVAGDGNTAPLELPDGRIVSVLNQTIVATNKARTAWESTGISVNVGNGGLVYSAFRNAFYTWQFDCDFTPPAQEPLTSANLHAYGGDYRLH